MSKHATRGIGRADQGEQPSKGRSWFLGIGINTYQHFPILRNAVGDVQAIYGILKNRYGIDEARLLFDAQATRRQIIRQLDALVEEVGADDKLIIYYSGHGHLNERNRGFWVPQDAHQRYTDDYLANGRLKEYLEDLKAKHILVFSDACFSGALFARGGTRNAGWDSTQELEKRISRYAICSGRHDEAVHDGIPGANSPFARSLLDILTTNQRATLRTSQLAERLIDLTTTQYRQLPQHGALYDVGDQGGQYIFRLAGGRLITAGKPDWQTKPSGHATSEALLTDPRDGKTYQTVLLNGQRWMAQNLDYDAGPHSFYYNNDPNFGEPYGRLYNWMTTSYICPPGWRLPTDDDWRQLALAYGGYYDERKKQTIGDPQAAFRALSQHGTSGFNAQFGGSRVQGGQFQNRTFDGYYWTASEYSATEAWFYYFSTFGPTLKRQRYYKPFGYSCRCVQENRSIVRAS